MVILEVVLFLLYVFENPYRICRKEFAKRKEQEIHMYGETPFSVWKHITILAEVHKEDVFLDLGCGRGRLCFWTKKYIGCKAIGVDFIKTFVKRAKFISFLLRIQDLEFHISRIKDFPLQEATCIYLYTYHQDEELLDFSKLSKGTRVITCSEPLSQEGFFVKTSEILSFPWGECEVFVNVFCGV